MGGAGASRRKGCLLVLEPPSEALQQRLFDWHLCQPSDLRRARRRVQQLSRDLPAFDSVWIDALVQLGCLSSDQARVLESEMPESLRCGDFVLVEDLGHRRNSRLWRARRWNGRGEVLLHQCRPAREDYDGVVRRGRQLVAKTAGALGPSLSAPQECWEDADGFSFVSPFVPGTTLRELLVRRGRFPAAIVIEIGRQLLAALAAAHARGVVHGDVRLAHVRLTDAGRLVLVQTGVRAVFTPQIHLHAGLPLESYDGVAPETIGVGLAPTVQSDLYAAGCVLWQLLAGRPPFPVAEPLAKLAAHQTRNIPDIREWAPETPAEFAETLLALTQRDPDQRPESTDDVLARWGRSTRRSRSALQSFRRQFTVAVPHFRSTGAMPVPRWGVAVALLFAVSGIAFSLADRGFRAELLALPGRWVNDTEPVAPAIVSLPDDRRPLPPLGADGVLLLTESGIYQPATIRFRGTVRLRVADGVRAEIVIRDEPLRISAESVMLEQVRLRYDHSWRRDHAAPGLAWIQSQQFALQRSVIDTGAERRRSNGGPEAPGINWRVIDSLSAGAGQVTVGDTLFLGRGTGLAVLPGARQVQLKNVAQLGGEALVSVTVTPEQPWPTVMARRVTLRGSDAFLQMRGTASAASSPFSVTADDCVFDLQKQGALLERWGEHASLWQPDLVAWNGEGSVLPPEATLVVWRDTMTQSRQTLPTDDWQCEGLSSGRITYAGLPTTQPADSALTECDAPRRSAALPGIDATALPTP